MNATKLFTLLAQLALVETPLLHDGTPKNNKYLESVHTMANLYVEVGSAGSFISPEIDPLVLAAIGYEESRHRVRVNDGDCRYDYRAQDTRCWSIGPMQLSRATPRWWKQIEPNDPLSVEQLRDPQTSVRVAYRMLSYWKDSCHGDLTATLSSWSAGKCLKKAALGQRRCSLVKAFAAASGLPEPVCTGHRGEYTVARVSAITRKDETK